MNEQILLRKIEFSDIVEALKVIKTPEMILQKGDVVDLPEIAEHGLKKKHFAFTIQVIFNDGLEAVINSENRKVVLEKIVKRDMKIKRFWGFFSPKIYHAHVTEIIPQRSGILCDGPEINEKTNLTVGAYAYIPVKDEDNNIKDLHPGIPVREIKISKNMAQNLLHNEKGQ